MEWRDIGRFFLFLFALLALDLTLAIIGLRDAKPDDYDKASIVAALFVVLRAIRERTPLSDTTP